MLERCFCMFPPRPPEGVGKGQAMGRKCLYAGTALDQEDPAPRAQVPRAAAVEPVRRARLGRSRGFQSVTDPSILSLARRGTTVLDPVQGKLASLDACGVPGEGLRPVEAGQVCDGEGDLPVPSGRWLGLAGRGYPSPGWFPLLNWSLGQGRRIRDEYHGTTIRAARDVRSSAPAAP